MGTRDVGELLCTGCHQNPGQGHAAGDTPRLRVIRGGEPEHAALSVRSGEAGADVSKNVKLQP